MKYRATPDPELQAIIIHISKPKLWAHWFVWDPGPGSGVAWVIVPGHAPKWIDQGIL